MSKPALGRGLGALLAGNPPASAGTATATPTVAAPDSHREAVLRVPLARIRPCPFQPRKDFAPEALRELADSIREQGIVQPLIVREQVDHLELIAGERRWRAAQLVGLTEVPVIVRQADDGAVLELALIENLQRENLNPIEEAQGYSQLMSQFALTQELVATKVGKSRAQVANALRLLKLPDEVQVHLREGRLSVGHAKVILGLTSADLQKLATERVLKDGLNVRQTEELVARLLTQAPAPRAGKRGATVKDAHVQRLENQIRERVGTKVHLRYAKGRGAIELAFYSDEELERLLQLLGVQPE
ncbi:MAG: ParB/RepB/Spo0J family partition protein [Limisphaerales bacterium]